eukprot:TRINITY_DN3098_c1_g1_i1.p1 TRINITY_DN3098_c1_g1~~TRINITY_DN3098_c1_g1_i1.p1  ORF type:complete len:376 (+),score=117.62 TRINITY_DN3098_c1_g1_i1:49-1176(+)
MDQSFIPLDMIGEIFTRIVKDLFDWRDIFNTKSKNEWKNFRRVSKEIKALVDAIYLKVMVNSTTSMNALNLAPNLFNEFHFIQRNVALLDHRHSQSIISSSLRKLGTILEGSTTIHSLRMDAIGIASESVWEIAFLLRESSTLKDLHLSLAFNRIDWVGATQLASVIEEKNTLISLNLGGNRMECEGAKAFASVLKSNPSLTLLDLSSNSIGNEGAIAIFSSLESNSILKSLDLRNNAIDGQGLEGIASSLKCNYSLTSLDLSSNVIGMEGAESIGLLLAENKGINTLILEYCKVKDEQAFVIISNLKHNSSLKSLSLGYNLLTLDGLKQISFLLRDNQSLSKLNLANGRITHSEKLMANNHFKENITPILSLEW